MLTMTTTATTTRRRTTKTRNFFNVVFFFLNVVTGLVAGFTLQEFGSIRGRQEHGESFPTPFVLTATRNSNGITTHNDISRNDAEDDFLSSSSSSSSTSSLSISSRDVFLSRLLLLTTGTGTAVSVAAATTTVATTTTLASPLAPAPCYAFDGGVGGLGKTKPQTGVILWDESSPPTQDNKRNNNGLITTEIQSSSSSSPGSSKTGGGGGDGPKPKPIRVAFESPSYPLSATSGGLEVRDVRSTESAYVFVLPATKNFKVLDDPKSFRDVLIDTVFSSQGKYGAYSPPTDITVKKLVLPSTSTTTSGGTSSSSSSNSDNDTSSRQQQRRLFSVTFTTLTPAMRESLRQIWIVAQPVYDDTIVCFIVGTTKAKFNENKSTFEQMVNSFVAVEAPPSSLRRSSVSSPSK